LLATTTVVVGAATLAVPYVPALQALFGFVALPAMLMAALLGIVLAYLLSTEALKRRIGSA
jgi:hypothetical protein